MKISQTAQTLAMCVKLARKAGNEQNYQAGIWAVVKEFAEAEIPGALRNMFYMLCGYEPHEIPR